MEDLPLVLIDGALIEQVLSNLLENAVKYTPPGSPIEIEAWAAGDEITPSVVDQGPGIKPGDEERVSEKFHRGVPKGAVGGTGLGLTICRGSGAPALPTYRDGHRLPARWRIEAYFFG